MGILPKNHKEEYLNATMHSCENIMTHKSTVRKHLLSENQVQKRIQWV